MNGLHAVALAVSITLSCPKVCAALNKSLINLQVHIVSSVLSLSLKVKESSLRYIFKFFDRILDMPYSGHIALGHLSGRVTLHPNPNVSLLHQYVTENGKP